MTPVEGSDLDKGVRPLSRGRKGVLHIAIHRSSALRALTCAYLTRIPQLGSFFGEGAIAYRTSRTPALMHPLGCYSDSCKFAGSPGEFIEPAKIKQKKLNSNA